jgi:catechol 2,3-dioxygenase
VETPLTQPTLPSKGLKLQFSHLGFYVTDLPKMAAFYKEALQFTQTDFGDLGAVQLVFPSRDPGEHHQIVLARGAYDMQSVTHGNAISIYCRDPEGNRLEIFLDTPWYCDQPLREPIDFAEPDDAIMARAEAIAKRLPKFMTRAEWQVEVARRMDEDQRG